jgi:hypothetical protein
MADLQKAHRIRHPWRISQKRRVPSQERVFLYRFLRISGECHSPPSIDHIWAIKNTQHRPYMGD